MPEIIVIGADWGYTSDVCDGCRYLEISDLMSDDPSDVLVACDVPEGKCVKNGRQVYVFEHNTFSY